MSEKENSPKSQEINTAMTGMRVAALAIGEALNDPVSTGMRKRDALTPPLKDSFGEFKEKLSYIEGCVISSEFEQKGVSEIAFQVRDMDDSVRTLAIGATPAEWNPKIGGRQIAGAGAPGDFLMLISRPATDGSIEQNFRYLDTTDFEGVRLEQGKDVKFAQNSERQRQIQVPGQVIKVVGFVA